MLNSKMDPGFLATLGPRMTEDQYSGFRLQRPQDDNAETTA